LDLPNEKGDWLHLLEVGKGGISDKESIVQDEALQRILLSS
jgi:hypothetical protein